MSTPDAATAADTSPTSGAPRVVSVTEALRRAWWIVILFVLLGGAAGAVFTLASADEYSATASVYVGQTTDANGNPMTGLSTNVRAATQLLGSDAVLQAVAEKVGVSASRLRRATTLDTPSQTVKTTQSIVSFVTIMVTDPDPQLAADAANALADELLSRIAPTTEQRIALLEQHEADLQAALDASRARSRAAEEALDALPGGGADAAAAAAPYMAVLQAAATEQQQLLSGLQKAQLMLQVANTTEQPRLLHEAVAPDAPAQNALALNVAAGALAGLVVGLVVALVRARPRATAA